VSQIDIATRIPISRFGSPLLLILANRKARRSEERGA